MKPWVRTTDKQIEELETAVSKITSALNNNSAGIDHEQNQSLSNTFSFTPLDDGSTVTNSQAMNFTGPVTTESDISIAGSLVVGDPSRQEYDPLSGEAIGSIPNLEVISGQLEINPITEIEYYTTGQLNMTDTSFNVDSYGLIHGDGLQITLANDGDAERQNIEILGATGTGTAETFQITNNASNVAVYTAGRYVNITGVDPAGYNGSNLLITSVNTGVSPMTFTVAGTETATYVAGGYVTINEANSIYEGKLTVQGPSPDYTGVTVSQDGVFVGSNGGDAALADVVLDSTGLTAPSAFIDQAVINGTRLFISSTPPTAVNDGDIWIDKTGIFTQGGGSVTSIGMTVPTGLTVSPSSITTSGTFAVALASGYSIPTTASQTNWDTSYTDRLKWDGGSTGLTPATGRTSLGATTVGSNLFTLASPSAVTFPRINADNTVSTLDAATFRTAIGAGTTYTLPKATAAALGGVELFDATVQTVAANAITTQAGRTYGAQLNSADQLVINVPWTDTVYTLPKATASALGGVELFDATVQTVAANAVTTTAGRTYGVQMNSADQLVVNVPWTSSFGYVGGYQTTASASTAVALTDINSITSTGALAINTPSGAPASSNITISSGTSSTAATGSVTISTGITTASSFSTGQLILSTGTPSSTGGNSGSISIQSGGGTGSSGNSGSLTIDSGLPSGAGTAGSIVIGTTRASAVTIGRAGGSTTIAGTLTALPTLPSTAQQLFLASPTSGSGTPTFRYISTSDFTQSSSPTIGQSLVAAPVTGGWSWGGPYLNLTGGTLTGGLTLAAPTSTLSSMTLTTGTQPTLGSQAFGQISAGAESVGIGTTKTTGAGPGFGIIKAPQMVFSLADATVAANSTTGVAAFAAANDTLSSLEAAKLYRFRGKYYVTYTAGGTAAALQMLFAFVNAPQAIKYNFRTTKSTSTTAIELHGIGAVATGVSVSASNQTSGTLVVEFDGYFTSNATTGGTFTPQIAASASTSGGTFVVTTGSWFEIQKMGTATQTLISGNWG
jgi:hypothetical protein